MKQIKTVIRKIVQSREFDEEVNRLLADGWTISKRAIINAHGEISESFVYPNIQVLYAELERQEPSYPEEITL